MKIQDLKDGTAATIEDALLSVCQQAGVGLSKVIGFGSDGASVMVGGRSGVATRLKSHNPSIVSVHCVAHRLALSAAQAADNVPYLKKFKRYLSQIFFYYHNSSVRSASLKAIQEVLDNPVLKTKAAGDTRWLSHDQAVSTIRRILPSLVAHVEKEAEEKGDALALGLVHVIRKYYFVASLYLLSDILPHLSRLSRLFQESDIDFSKVQVHVANTLEVLEALKVHDGPYMQKLDSALEEELSACRVIVKDVDPHNFAKNVKIAYIEELIENVRSRFPDVAIISALSIFNSESIPPTSSEEFSKYGEEQLDVLKRHFKEDVIDHGSLDQEWVYFKQLLLDNCRGLTTREVIEMIIKDSSLRTILPQFCKVANIAKTVPVSTADCERGFSAVKRIKTVLRNRLKTETLDCLLRISVEGPQLKDFDFDSAATFWASRRNRRLKV